VKEAAGARSSADLASGRSRPQPAGALPAQARLLLPLQESAGNQAVAGLVQRWRDYPHDDELQVTQVPSSRSRFQPEPLERRNDIGLPHDLKSGIESLSGVSLDDVNVHYNSHRPAELDALAYAQGTDIHVAPGQERHLPHEAWHVVQQAQGRVQATTQLQGGVAINDDEALEREADAMGATAMTTAPSVQRSVDEGKKPVAGIVQRVREHFVPDALEPHIHVHDGGVTFTDVGHSHKYLQRGDKRLESNIREVRADLAQRGDPRSRKINRWIARRL
jgi:hypothetical protein